MITTASIPQSSNIKLLPYCMIFLQLFFFLVLIQTTCISYTFSNLTSYSSLYFLIPPSVCYFSFTFSLFALVFPYTSNLNKWGFFVHIFHFLNLPNISTNNFLRLSHHNGLLSVQHVVLFACEECPHLCHGIKEAVGESLAVCLVARTL